MVREASGHGRRSMPPSWPNETCGRSVFYRQWQSQAHVWPGEVVEGLEEADPLSQLFTVFAEAQRLARKRSKRLAQGEVEALNQAGADGKAKFFQAVCATDDAFAQGLEPALLFLFDDLRVDQIGMRLHDGISWTASLARSGEGLDLMVDRHEGGQVGTEAVAEKAGDPPHHSSCHLDQAQGTVEGPGSNEDGQQQTKLRIEADPKPLSAVLAGGGGLSIWTRAIGLLSLDEVPHLIQLDLGNRKLSQQMYIDFSSFLRSPMEPIQYGFLGHSEHETNPGKIHANQQHLQSHHDLLFGRSEIIEDRVTRLSKTCLAEIAVEDASFATFREVSGNRLDVAPVDQSVMGAVRVGARLPPVLRPSHGATSQVDGGTKPYTRRPELSRSFSKY